MATRRPTKAEIIKIQRLLDGEEIGFSSLSGPVFRELINREYIVLDKTGRKKMVASVKDPVYLKKILRQEWQINDIEEYLEFLSKEEKDRTDVQNMLGGTKEEKTSTFQGFLVTSLETVSYTLNGQKGTLPLINGSYLFVSDYETFKIDDDIIIIYVENFTSFRQIARYIYLFEPGRYLFVSRLLSSNAFKDWLKGIPNRYIHFGDFDLAGIGIYLHFYDEIGQRASFLVPDDIEERIVGQGNSTLYYSQEEKCRNMKVTDKRVQPLVDMIKKFRMGYEQEGYAK
jgi:hypothetical protein